MIRPKPVARCKICGREAPVSKWWTKVKNGRMYYYIRYQHSSNKFHLVPTDSSYSRFLVDGDKAKNLYAALEDYATKKMKLRRFRYTSLIRELERTYKMNFSNEEFNRALGKAISNGLIEKINVERETMYIRASSTELIKEININRMSISYSLSATKVRVVVFLEVTNNTSAPLEEIPFYIPVGMINSLSELHLKGQDEIGTLPESSMKIVLPMSMQTLISILLNRILRNSEQEQLSLSYEIPRTGEDIHFITPAKIRSMRITTTSNEKYNIIIDRILLDGAKETILPFRRRCISSWYKNCLEIELDEISKGENISIAVSTV
ncbi:MAG: hypothetical protein LVQ63_06720 [Thermoplasmatales archaeon]|nr:hypothetical protein [Thermoplasmatales archaeon]